MDPIYQAIFARLILTGFDKLFDNESWKMLTPLMQTLLT